MRTDDTTQATLDPSPSSTNSAGRAQHSSVHKDVNSDKLPRRRSTRTRVCIFSPIQRRFTKVQQVTWCKCHKCGRICEIHKIVSVSARLTSIPTSPPSRGRLASIRGTMSHSIVQNFKRCNRNEFAITETELKLMAAAAIIGLSSSPKKGYRIPAASGIPTEL